MPIAAHLEGRSTVRWGIIGCGAVTEEKSGPAFQKAAHSELVAVMRRDGVRARDYAKRHGVARWYDAADALIADPDVDVVYVATPPGSHADLALKIASAGKPAYIEKPMARHVAECDRMLEAFACADLPLFVAHYRRRLPRFLALERLLRERAIGDVTGWTYRLAMPLHGIDAGWRTDAAQAGGGHFLDMAPHVLDLLDYLAGPLRNVCGCAANRAGPAFGGVEDTVTMSFATATGAPGLAGFNFASSVPADMLSVAGTAGEIVCSVFGDEPLQLRGTEGNTTVAAPNPRHVQQPLIQSIVDDLLGRGICPSTGETARRTARAMDTVLDPFYAGRSDAFWLRPHTWARRSAYGKF